MPAVATDSSKTARRSKQHAPSTFNVKSALDKLMTTKKEWSTIDSKANHYLYGLLGEIYETIAKIGKNETAIATLRAECADCNRIKQSKMFKLSALPVPELLIAYTLGNTKNESKRSQWKTTLTVAKASKVETSKAAFSKWLDDAGGIEGVISKGKLKAPHKSAPPADFKALMDSLTTIYSLEQCKLPMPVDISTAKSFSDESFFDNYALVMVVKDTDAETAAPQYAILDVVNDKDLLKQAAEKIRSEHLKTH